jgi:hypothetical protein
MTGRIPPPPARTGPAALAAALARDAFGREIMTAGESSASANPIGFTGDPNAPPAAPKEKATDALGRRAGALMDEIAFPTFVASLVHGTYDAIVDSAIRQVEGFAELVSAVSKPLEQFAGENVTPGQVRAWLVEQYPKDVTLLEDRGSYTIAPLRGPDDENESPVWLADFGAEGEDFSAELLEERVLPAARLKVAQTRLSTLSTMVLLGMQRVVVKDGTISAGLKFRAAAADRAAVQYATSNDPQTGGSQWGARGNEGAITTVSTVSVNAQSDSELRAEVTGNVRINFASETLPLDRFVDEAQRTLLERHSRRSSSPASVVTRAPAITPTPAPVVAGTAPAVAPVPGSPT